MHAFTDLGGCQLLCRGWVNLARVEGLKNDRGRVDLARQAQNADCIQHRPGEPLRTGTCMRLVPLACATGIGEHVEAVRE